MMIFLKKLVFNAATEKDKRFFIIKSNLTPMLSLIARVLSIPSMAMAAQNAKKTREGTNNTRLTRMETEEDAGLKTFQRHGVIPA
jgi:hypothetical protein